MTVSPERHAGLLAVDATLQELQGEVPTRKRLRAFYAAVLQAMDGKTRLSDQHLFEELFARGLSRDKHRLVPPSSACCASSPPCRTSSPTPARSGSRRTCGTEPCPTSTSRSGSRETTTPTRSAARCRTPSPARRPTSARSSTTSPASEIADPSTRCASAGAARWTVTECPSAPSSPPICAAARNDELFEAVANALAGRRHETAARARAGPSVASATATHAERVRHRRRQGRSSGSPTACWTSCSATSTRWRSSWPRSP